MFSIRVTLSLTAISMSLAMPCGVAQEQHSASSRGKSSDEELRAYGIDLSRRSLIAALSNDNAKIRVLAAYQLASDRDIQAITAIDNAYSHEGDPLSRVGFATALASLGAPQGESDLTAICTDNASSVIATIKSIQMLELLGRSVDPCIDSSLTAVDDPKNADYRDAIISLLPKMYKKDNPVQSEKILASLEHVLSDRAQQPSAHIAAGDALSGIGSSSSIPILQNAISVEGDPVVKDSLSNSLTVIETNATYRVVEGESTGD